MRGLNQSTSAPNYAQKGLFHRARLAVFLLAQMMVIGGLSACQITPSVAEPVPTSASAQCGQKRPEMCTQQYLPVCGYDAKGQAIRTYGNACSACGDSQVMRHTQGECSH